MTVRAPRKTAEITRDRLRIAELYLAGKKQVEIAKLLGLDQSTVSRDLSFLHREWQLQATHHIDEAKALELAKIDQLERTYWAAWERSCQEKKRHSTRTSGTITRDTSSGERNFIQETPAQQVFTTAEQTGDVRYLHGVQWCIERRCKILGIDAASRFDVRSIDLTRLSDEQLDRLAAGEDPTYVLANSSPDRA